MADIEFFMKSYKPKNNVKCIQLVARLSYESAPKSFRIIL